MVWNIQSWSSALRVCLNIFEVKLFYNLPPKVLKTLIDSQISVTIF
jgi:hypothetical protein